MRNNFPNLRCIGFDFISLSSWKYKEIGRESHKSFLSPSDDYKQPILVIEDMSLMNIANPINWVIVAPLMIEDGNGGPVTAIGSITI